MPRRMHSCFCFLNEKFQRLLWIDWIFNIFILLAKAFNSVQSFSMYRNEQHCIQSSWNTIVGVRQVYAVCKKKFNRNWVHIFEALFHIVALDSNKYCLSIFILMLSNFLVYASNAWEKRAKKLRCIWKYWRLSSSWLRVRARNQEKKKKKHSVK